MLTGVASPALGAETFCSQYGGVIDGNVDPVPTQVTIDTDCTFQNFPPSNPLTTTVNFHTNDPSIYLIIFDNVIFTGNMACANIDHRIWFSNGSDYGSGNACQDLFIPVETIDKANPAGPATASIGEPFTYTLTLPSMQLTGEPSVNDLHSITISDDLTATGADLSYVSHRAYLKGSGEPVPLTFINPDDKHLTFQYDLLPAGEQVVLELTVVLDDTAANLPGTQFSNIAKWWFGRLIEGTFYEPLPGEWGRTQPLTIAAPELVVTKTGPDLLGGLNLGEWGEFTVDVANNGNGDAWSVTVDDLLPDGATGGMCDMMPQVTGVRIEGGASRTLAENTDYTLDYSGCELTLELLDAAGPIGPGEHLVVTYQSKLDADSQNGSTLTNVAGAVQWFSADSSQAGRRAFTRTLSDGTVGTPDHEDAHEVMVALSGLFFEKTVANRTTGKSPAAVAAPGDTLRYTLRLQSIDRGFNNLAFHDDLGALNAAAVFVPGSLTLVSVPAGADSSGTAPFGGTNGAGVLDVRGLDVAAGGETTVVFDVTLAPDLGHGTVVANQADLLQGANRITVSDDPNINGQANPDPAVVDEDPTRVTVETPQPPVKAIVPDKSRATIGEEVVYQITVPGTPYAETLENVVVTDTLDPALTFVGAVSGATPLTNTSTVAGQVRLPVGTIGAGDQAVITITARIADLPVVSAGDSFTNAASYAYGGSTALSSAPTHAVSVVEPALAPTKSVSPAPPATPSVGDILTYTITLPAEAGPNRSDAFDVAAVDTLGPGLRYLPGTTKIDGTAAPDPALGGGDGTEASQTLSWEGLDIPAGTASTVSYQVEVLASVIPGQTLDNDVLVQWSSLDGAAEGERTYSATTAAPELSTPPDRTALAKTRLSDTFRAGDADLRIGDRVEFELRVDLQEGTHTGLVLTDTLPAGMIFEAVTSADFFGTPVTAVPAVDGRTLTWDLGTVVNPGDGDPDNDRLLIAYRARVLNGDVLAQVDSTPLTNAATLDYTLGGAAAPRLTAGQTVTVLQPLLAVSKGAAPAGGDTIIAAGEAITYTVDIVNRGAAPAYDPVLVDTLPPGLRLGGVTALSATLVNAGTVLPVATPDYDAGTGTITWDLDSGTADAYTIPAGETLRLVYRVAADAGLGAGLTLSNAATVRRYYSFDDEAVPNGGAPGQREDYGPSNTATANLTTAVAGGPLKQNPPEPVATIGQEFTYTITIPAVPQPTALHDVRILDDLGAVSADLALVGLEKISGSQAWTPVNTGTGSALAIEDAGAGIEIPANEQIVVGVTLRMNNVAGNAEGLSYSNLAAYTYDVVDGDPATRTAGGSSATSAMTVVEPDLTATKTAGNATPGKAADAPVVGGDLLEYAVTITNDGTATAYDVNVIDSLPSALAFADGFVPTATLDLAPVGGFVAPPGGAPDGPLVWGRDNGDDSLDIPAGGRLVLTYRAQVIESTATTFSNRVWVDWTSLDGASAHERTGAGCPATTPPDDYCSGPASVAVTTSDNNGLAKAIVADTYVEAPSTADDKVVRVGDTATYRLTLNLGEGTTRNVRVRDELPAGMAYDGPASITPASGTGSFTYSVVSRPAPGATGSLTWELGNVVNAPSNDGTPVDALVVEYRARVLPGTAIARAPTTTLTNTATLSYEDGAGNTVTDPTRLVASDALTLWQPQLTVGKSAVPAGGDAVIEAGETITYTLDIVNGGEGPAYDPVLVDTLPPGLREGGVTTLAMTLVNAGTDLPVPAPDYAVDTGTVTWNLDTGTAGAYTIPAGETLRVVYRVTADADLGAGLTLTNAAFAERYHSFDDEDVPAGGAVSDRRVYGPTETARVSLTAPVPDALRKENTQPTAAVGERFRYRITVPATPVNTALHDVRILDDLGASAADLRFVSVARVSGSASWTPVNTGSDTNLVIEDPAGGIDIPAGEQAVLDLTVELLDTPTNVVGLSFTNTADYTYNRIADSPASRTAGLPDKTAPMRIVGLVAQKTVAIAVDNNGNGLLDPGDVLTYTITVSNPGAAPVTGVLLTDEVPADTGYLADSTTLNGLPAGSPDGGRMPLAAGMAVQAAGAAAGTIPPGASAVVTFQVMVADAPPGTVISNQGYLASNELPTEPTDADGNAANGYQPTTIVVGSDQQVMIAKEVSVVGGGAALPGGELEYLVRVTNTGTIPVTDLLITDDLTALAGQATYVAGSATLDGAAAGVDYALPVLTGRYAATYGELPPGETAILRFRVLIADGLASGTRLTNTAQMAWNTPTLTATASASIDVGGSVGSAALSGQVWHDADLDKACGTAETHLAGWKVGLYRNDTLVASVATDGDGRYRFTDLEPTLTAAGRYELRFSAPGAGPGTPSLGMADSPFTDGPQRISDVAVASGDNLEDLNLPLRPNGTVYDAVRRTPVAGAGLALLNAATEAPLPERCFDDPAQQNQVTARDGFYKFDLNFSDPSCPPGGTYAIAVTPPPTGYVAAPSRLIPPAEDATTPFSVPACPGSTDDALPATGEYCEVTASAAVPPPGAAPGSAGTVYHLFLTLDDEQVPGQSQVFNNHLPVDPELDGAVALSKTTPLINVSRGQPVPYTVTATNRFAAPLYDLAIIDRLPAGFKYVSGSARLDGEPREPLIRGRELSWNQLQLQVNDKRTVQLLLVPGAGVGEGEFVNRAQVLNAATGGTVSGEATATVRVIPDPTFDCTDVIGKVFDDRNLDGRQDPGEEGLAGVDVATVRGLVATSDRYGRFHIACAAVPDRDRGSNFILKLDDRTLPTGYRLTTENPRVLRATRGKTLKFDFGATIHRVVGLDVAAGAFEPETARLRPQWRPRLDKLLAVLRQGPAVLRLSYLADVEPPSLVDERLAALKATIVDRWGSTAGNYRLTIETEVFWRRGGPR